MCGFWNKLSNKHGSSAKVVDGNLILSLPDAITPVVWRMELGSVRASALEVRATNDNTYLLALKTPKGDVHDIAPFDTRDKALNALMNVSHALQGAEGKMNAVSAGTAPQMAYAAQKSGGALKWVLAIGGILVVLYVLASLFTTSPAPETTNATTNSAPSGVPVPADQILRGF